jgi:hypothetical protein
MPVLPNSMQSQQKIPSSYFVDINKLILYGEAKDLEELIQC